MKQIVKLAVAAVTLDMAVTTGPAVTAVLAVTIVPAVFEPIQRIQQLRW